MAKEKKQDKMNPFQWLLYWLLLGGAKLIGLLPYCVLYRVLSPLIYFIFYHLVGYRKKVVRRNLAGAFPEKSEAERREIERKFYHHLADVFVDVLDLTSMSAKELRSRMEITNLEEFDSEVGNKSWIGALGHYGDWEYFCSFAIDHHYPNLGVYHPLSSKVMDKFMIHMRTRFGMEVIPMFNLGRRVLQCVKEQKQMAIGLIADQRAQIKFTDKRWRMFLNHPTLFIAGMGHYAKRFGMPVYVLETDQVKPSYYKCKFVRIYDGVEDISDVEIADRYVAALEDMIRRKPELWLWSHKRWKHVPEEGAVIYDPHTSKPIEQK